MDYNYPSCRGCEGLLPYLFLLYRLLDCSIIYFAIHHHSGSDTQSELLNIDRCLFKSMLWFRMILNPKCMEFQRASRTSVGFTRALIIGCILLVRSVAPTRARWGCKAPGEM